MRHLLTYGCLVTLAACSGAVAQSCDDPFAGSGPIQFTTRGWLTDFCIHSVPLEEFRSGGPPRDGIPPIDEPQFTTVDEADRWIEDAEPIIAVILGDHARAYPLQILTWHEIVNDEVAGVPLAVTFCPLCYTAIVFERPQHEGEVLTFGTTGNLRHSDLVMWDRQTESWWQQFSGEAVVGALTGTVLESVPAPLISWKEFRMRHPDAKVLSKETGFDRRYGANPYVGYDDASKPPWLYDGDVGSSLRPMDRVVGVETNDSHAAYRLDDLEDRRVINAEVGGEAVVLFWTKEAASALDDDRIADGKRVGSVAAYQASPDGRKLEFERRRNRFFDLETGSEWNLFGEATDGPLHGRRLSPVQVHHTFWFVWSAFKGPESLVLLDD